MPWPFDSETIDMLRHGLFYRLLPAWTIIMWLILISTPCLATTTKELMDSCEGKTSKQGDVAFCAGFLDASYYLIRAEWFADGIKCTQRSAYIIELRSIFLNYSKRHKATWKDDAGLTLLKSFSEKFCNLKLE